MWKAVAIAACGCSASVQSFTASPDHLCGDVPVTLSWQVAGTGHMTSAAGTGAPNGDVDSQSSITIHPTGSGRVELHVTRFMGAPATSWQDIWVDELAESIAVGLDRPGARCDASGVSATATITGFTDATTVVRIAPRHGDRHAYRVTHAGHPTVSVDPSAASPSNTDLAGTAIGGDWQLQAAFLDGEACGSPALPPTLGIEVYTACRSGR